LDSTLLGFFKLGRTRRYEVHVEILVTNLVYPGIVVRSNFDPFKLKKQNLGEMDVI